VILPPYSKLLPSFVTSELFRNLGAFSAVLGASDDIDWIEKLKPSGTELRGYSKFYMT
jgi:hypothetical protein